MQKVMRFGCFRLVGGTGRIQACLFKAFLHKTGNGLNGMPYEALSYTWGTNEKPEQIILNGERLMVAKNLYSALQYLRFKNEDRILWIDAICIDQSHIAERNHQVGHMASIYSDAERVLFWLGEPTYQTDLLISSLIRLQALASDTPNITREKAHDSRWRILWNKLQFYEDSPLLLRGLVLLLTRPWFERSWILQEVCYAKTGVVICGTKEIAANIFALAPWLLDLDPEAHCKAVLNMMPGATLSTRDFLSGREIRNFYSLLRRFHRSEATDPRDQVYALLSMATDANMAGFPGVDYGKEYKEVINSIFKYLFPRSWYRCGRSHSYQSLSEFVEDFPHLRKAEIRAANGDILSTVRLSDDTELMQLHAQGGFRTAVQKGNALLLHTLLKFPNINLNEKNHPYNVKDRGTALSRPLPPLCAAAASGFTDVVKLLVGDSRLDINCSGSTALGWAIANKHIDVVHALANNDRIDITASCFSYSHYPPPQSVQLDMEATIEVVLNTIADPNVDITEKGYYYNRTLLSLAAQKEHEAVVKRLLTTSQAEVNLEDKVGRTPLSWAAQKGYEAVAKLLLETGQAEVNSKDYSGRTPLSWAAQEGHETMVKLLLATGQTEVNSKDKFGRTPLSWAAREGHETIVKLLLATGQAEVNSKDKFGRTPLLWVAKKGHETVIKLLLATGQAEVNSKDYSGRTPLSWAAQEGHEAVVKLLLATGQAEVNSKNYSGQTPLSWAAKKGHEAVVKLLLEAKANIE